MNTGWISEAVRDKIRTQAGNQEQYCISYS